MIYEVAEGRVTNRRILKTEEELPIWAWENGVDKALYTSVYCYSPTDREELESKKTNEWSQIQRWIQWIPIDIDKGDNSDEETIRKAAHVLFQLRELGIQNYNIKLYFSGRGYHLMIHEGCFNFEKVLKDKGLINDEPFLDFPYIVKETMRSLPEIGNNIDLAIYQRNGILRTTYSLNEKSGLYKIPVTINEILSLKWKDIHDLAKTRRDDFNWEPEYSGDGELQDYIKTSVPPVRAYTAVREPQFIQSCIYKMLEDGPTEGTRNNAVLRIASYLKRCGLPSNFAKAALIDWNNNSLDEVTLLEKIESAYNRNYNYGCSDSLRVKYCNPRCDYYADKSLIDTPDSWDSLVKSIYETDFRTDLKLGVDLARICGIEMYGSDFIALRGEVVSIIGMTKAGKSTFMKHVALGLSLADMSIILEDERRKTLYYTGEEDPKYFLLNCCRILENCSKQYMLNHKNELLDKWIQSINHIMPYPTSGKLKRLEEDIEREQPEQIMIDTLDHFVDKGKGPAGIEEAMLYFQELAVKYNIIVYQVSQVNRQDSRDSEINLFSGKGSGSIENQSRKVIGLSMDDTKLGKAKFLANSTGESGQEFNYQILASSRMHIPSLPRE